MLRYKLKEILINNMRHKITRRNVLLFCALLISSILSSKLSANIDGQWIYHSAANLTSDSAFSRYYRIIDGEKFVYYLVRGCNYDNRSASFTYSNKNNMDPVQLLRYDKSSPWAPENIKSIAGPETSGYIIQMAEYSPRLGLLVVIYDNNMMDLIYDDGRIISSTALYRLISPSGATNAFSITFDLDEDVFYLATSHGYQKIDATNGENLQVVQLNKKISWAGRVGDKMVLFGGDNVSNSSYSTQTYCFDVNKVPASLEGHELILSGNLTGVSTDGKLPNLQGLMPLQDNSFAAFASTTSDTQCPLIRVELSNEGNKGEILVDRCTFDNSSIERYRHLFKTDGRYSYMRKGYMVSDNSNVYLITTDSEGTSFEKISKTGLNTRAAGAKMSTIDGETFWTHQHDDFVEKRGVLSYRLSDGVLKQDKELIWPNAPISMLPINIQWSPKYGMLFRGPGSSFEYTIPDFDYFFSYKDGVWKDMSHATHALNKKYFNITVSQYGIGLDPINEDWVWGSSIYGMTRFNLADYDNFFMVGSSKRTEWPVTYPGFLNVGEPNTNTSSSSESTYYNVSIPSFDKDNNMWFCRQWKFNTNLATGRLYTMQYLPLLYWTAEEREAMANIGSDASKYIQPHELRIPHTRSEQHSQIIAMTSAGNENYIAHTGGTYINTWRSCSIYDHNGTLDDTSDDRYVILDDLKDEEGNPYTYDFENTIYEDTYHGDLWIGHQKGITVVNPTRALDGDKIVKRVHVTRRDGVEVNEFPLEATRVYKISDDNLGRKWIATEVGLFCLSRDSKELLGHYTVNNSPLPSNMIYSVGCDMETGSVFLCTDQGLVEFQPSDNYKGFRSEDNLTVWPSTIDPEYHGYVKISGVQASAKYVVTDEDGNLVRTLGSPVDGVLHWDLVGNNGQEVKNGRYDIHREGVNESNKVNVIRGLVAPKNAE